MIEASQLTCSYGGVLAVDGVDVATAPGRVVGLIGPNGSGKSTVLRLLHGRLRPRSGSVRVDGVELSRMSARDVARSIAVVAQEQEAAVDLSAAEMVLLGRLPRRSRGGLGGLGGWSAADRAAAQTALERVGLLPMAGRPLSALSGGEQRRVMIARAMAQETDHLLLDEPTNHLDIRYQHEVLATVRSLARTSIVVLHDLNLAARYCDELVLLDGGRVAAAGAPQDVLRPEILEPVYGIGVRRLADEQIHLAFGPGEGRAGTG
ncbi:ABC transporter ATP-binding protein [Kocuria palustris]|uniref:ABC transporter ATP-binding protein n=1 Tax=Kocuria palustris TaxID=71999 RepID=UPI0011A2481B|nr:ABC transporter ATP-binding protein [Kocuria palustris]